jgi:hypothetical protein
MNRNSLSCMSLMLVSASAFVAGDAGTAEAFLLVQEGQPRASIVSPKGSTRQEQRAAAMLQEYIQKSSGAKLPIVQQTRGNAIIVGKSATARRALGGKKLDADGFLLQGVSSRQYVIMGGTDWGTEFGVNDFLERYLGVRWLMPGAVGTSVPRHRTINVPDKAVVQNPVYVSRQISPASDIMKANDESRWARVNRAKPRIKFHHNLLHLFPGSKYGKTHPEFYPMIGGRRHIPMDKTDESWQPNLSAPGIVDAAVKEIEEYFRKNPGQTSYSLGMNDSSGWDQSPASKARRSGRKNYLGLEDVSDDYFTWANAVVSRVLKKYPDKWFGMLAYRDLGEPPTRVKVHPRIVPFLTYDRMRWEDPKLRAKGQKITQDWAKVAPVVGWYDYAYGISYQLPRVAFHRMQNYLSWGAKHQVSYSYAELYPNWGEGPKPWVFAKLLWNPHQNVDALMDDWYRHCAGPKAAPELRKFYAVWERFWTVDIYKSRWNTSDYEYWPFNDDPSYLADVPQSYIARADASMQAALKLADTPQRKARVAKLNQMWDFYKSSILTYQGMREITRRSPRTESEALVAVQKFKGILPWAQKRQALLETFSKDPLFQDSAKFITIYPGTNGSSWVPSLMWQILPWAEKSVAVRAEVQKMMQSPESAVAEQARLMMRMADGKSVLVTTNESFETGDTGWALWDKSSEGPEYQKGEWGVTKEQAYSGESSMRVKGLQRGGLIQFLPYKPGEYFARARCYVPQGGAVGDVSMRLQVLDAKGEALGTEITLPEGTVALEVNSWASTTLPFKLPVDKTGKAASVRLLLLLNRFQPDGVIYIDDVGVLKIED